MLTDAGTRKAIWPVYEHLGERYAEQLAASLRRVLESARQRAVGDAPATS